MSGQATYPHATWAGWIIQRNPVYLLSAALMALGARLYLVSPRTRAGDVGLILLTLGILQVYEWAVAAVLLALHRRGLSPEDKPSLLVVAALFWTGPMAATAEMTAHRMMPGLICAGMCCLIALAEMEVVRRAMGLRFSLTGRAAACACVLLLAVAPPLVRMPMPATGTNEVFLYATWWLLAALALAGVATVRHHARCETRPTVLRDFRFELGLLALAVGATAAHLSAMSYAYFGHAQWFYASPLVIAVAVVTIEFIASTDHLRFRASSAMLLRMATVLPAVAIVAALQKFDEHMPLRALPVFMRDPLLSMLVIAAAAWWFGFWRLRAPIMLHCGSMAIAWAAVRVARLPALEPAMPAVGVHPIATRDLLVVALYMLAAYFVLIAVVRRSRTEALAAIIVHQVALTLLVWNRTPADVMILCLSVGWCWLAGLALMRRPDLTALTLPIAFLLLVTWGYDLDKNLCWHARSHAAAMMLVLVGLSLMWPDSRYGLLTVVAGLADASFYTSRWISYREHATAAFVVVGAFALLAMGAMISWQKRTLLAMVTPPPAPPLLEDEAET